MSRRLTNLAFAALVAFSGLTATQTAAAEETVNFSKEAKVANLDESTALVEIDDVSFEVDENGVATATDTNTGETEVLPEDGVDKDGNGIKYVYQTDGDTLQLRAVNEFVPETNWGKCAAGTAGGAATGAAVAGLTGAAAGTVTLPLIGTVGGGAVGATVGGVGGGLTGAAQFCFD
ncbi:MAG: hypothetical protein Q4A92_06945 [Corynebacterium sp.]|nr:hypothetical protein [Corynebacterium sp.]